MPKFLDAPSWYDSTGTLQTIQRVVSLNLSTPGYGLAWNIPVTNAKVSQETDNYYVVPGAGTNTGSLLTWQNNGGVYSWGTSPRGAEGAVLTATSSGVSWKTPSNLLFVTADVLYNGEDAGNINLIVRTTSSSISTSSALLSAIQTCGIHSSYTTTNYYTLPASGIFNAYSNKTQTSPLYYPSPVSYVTCVVPSSGSSYLQVRSLMKRQIGSTSTYVIDESNYQVGINNVESSLAGRVLV